jgi:WXG100 family type VII secretion target
MDGFDATPTELQVCATTLADITAEIESKLATLRRDVEGLLSGGWQGGAARAFADGWEQWQGGARRVVEALADMGSLLGSTGREYSATNRNASDLLARLEGRL